MHDGILVGVGTALNDDPQLNSKGLDHFPPGAERSPHEARIYSTTSACRGATFAPSADCDGSELSTGGRLQADQELHSGQRETAMGYLLQDRRR